MRIIEALKQVKDLQRKADDLISKIKVHCADMNYETPVYPDQRSQVSGWVQAHTDIVREIGRLKYLLQKTNVLTKVTIRIGDNDVTKSISEWIARRKELAQMEKRAYDHLTNRGLREGKVQQSAGQVVDVSIRLYFDAAQRDKMINILASEPSLIDAKLEIVNATTELLNE